MGLRKGKSPLNKAMVWLTEKKIFRHILDTGFDRVEIPVRVKFEFEVKEGTLVPDSLSKKILYNQGAIEKRYPKLRLSSLDSAIEGTVRAKIMEYLRQCGLFQEAT